MTDPAELSRLILQVERDVVARASLKTLLAAIEARLVDHRSDLRIVQARIKAAVKRAAGPRTPARGPTR